jgi:hypothetical protein
MSDFRHRLREAFAAEQQGLEPIAGVSHALLDGRLTGRGRRGLLPQLAAALGIVLAVSAVVGILVLTRAQRSATPARSQATVAPSAAATPAPRPTPVSNAFTVPDSVPALVFGDAIDHSQLDAVAWAGTGLGRIAGLPAGVVVPNPSGTLFITAGGIVDRRGQVVASLLVADKQAPPTWADDGRTLCRISSATGTAAGVPAFLETAALTGGWRRVGQYGTVHDQSGVGLAACSVLNDRAVIVERAGQGTSTKQVWVVQMSTGRVVWSRSYQLDGSGTTETSASRDGSYVAEGSARCCPMAGFKTTVYGPDGSIVRAFDGHAGGYAGASFSWDGERMVLASGTDEGTVTVVDVRSGVVEWTAPPGRKVAGVVAEPVVGGRLGVILNDKGAFAGSDGYAPTGDLYFVDASGTARRLGDTQARPL